MIRAPRPAYLPVGTETMTRAPWPRSLSIVTSPPCWSTIFRTIDRPRPVPASFVVKNGLEDARQDLGLDAGTAVVEAT